MSKTKGKSKKSRDVRKFTGLTVNVKHSGANVQYVTVTLEPRESGLETSVNDVVTGSDGNAFFPSVDPGYWDIDLTHDTYGNVTHQRRNISGATDTENTTI